MTRILYFFLICLVASACSSKLFVVREPFENAPLPARPDYHNPNHWAALPDKRDASDSVPLRSNLKDGQQTAQADVFFIYPTLFTGAPNNSYIWNADVQDVVLNEKIQSTTILNQASIFNGSCRVYAPYYRQAHLWAFYTDHKTDASQSLNLAYEDVRAAFEYYLVHFNQGRPIVIASHSQGSYHGERLIKDYFDGKPLAKQLVAAYLVGRAIRPDEFVTIKPSEKPDETGVWSSWNTFGHGFLPRDYFTHFKGALSTNPLLWNSSSNLAPKELNHGGVGFGYTFVPMIVDAQNHDGILWVHRPNARGSWLVRNANWHRADMNFFYMNIRENVALRIETYFKTK